MGSFVPVPRDVPTVVTGERSFNNTLAGRQQIDMRDEIILIQPSMGPLATLSAKMRGKREVGNYEFKFLEKDPLPRTMVVSGNQIAGDTSIELLTGHGDRAAANYVLMNTRTGEHILVSSVSTDTLTVVRGIGSSAAAMVDGDILYFTRAVFSEGSDSGALKSTKEVSEFNYTEQIRTAYGWTGRQKNAKLYGGSDVALERKFQGIEHKKSIEHMFYFGRRHTRTESNGQLRTFAGGLDYFIESNRWDLDGNPLTERAFKDFLADSLRDGKGGYQNGSGVKYLFASAAWVSAINDFVEDMIEYRPMDDVIGFAAKQYKSPFGQVMIFHSALLDQIRPDMAFLVDLNHFRYVYFSGRDSKIIKDIQDPGVDGEEEEWLSDISCEVTWESSHAVLQGLPV
jgi:hypothetical protein